MHAEGAIVTQHLRERLKQEQQLGKVDKEYVRLVPLHLTEAERGEHAHLPADTVAQLVRNSGVRKAGQRLAVAQLDGVAPAAWSAYQPDTISLAVGDTIRTTAGGKDQSGRHRINNGTLYTVAGFGRDGSVKLNNGWVLSKDFGHWQHACTLTSMPRQGRSVDQVIAVASTRSLAAVNQRQAYVDWTRGKQISVATDDKAALLAAAQRTEVRPSAVEVFGVQSKPRLRQRLQKAVARIKRAVTFRQQQPDDCQPVTKPRENVDER
jgi:hypothetical protein